MPQDEQDLTTSDSSWNATCTDFQHRQGDDGVGMTGDWLGPTRASQDEAQRDADTHNTVKYPGHTAVVVQNL